MQFLEAVEKSRAEFNTAEFDTACIAVQTDHLQAFSRQLMRLIQVASEEERQAA